MAGVDLNGRAAFFAQKKDRRAGAGADIASYERILALDAVGEAEPHKEIQRPVNCRRFGGPVVGPRVVEQIVSLGRPLAVQQQFEHAAAQRRRVSPTDAQAASAAVICAERS